MERLKARPAFERVAERVVEVDGGMRLITPRARGREVGSRRRRRV